MFRILLHFCGRIMFSKDKKPDATIMIKRSSDYELLIGHGRVSFFLDQLNNFSNFRNEHPNKLFQIKFYFRCHSCILQDLLIALWNAW